VPYDPSGTHLAAGTTQDAIDEIANGSLARDLVGTWTGYLLDIEFESGDEATYPGVFFTFGADGAYMCNLDAISPHYQAAEYRWEGRWWAFGDDMLMVSIRNLTDTWGDRVPFTVARDAQAIVLVPTTTVFDVIVLDEHSE
jgi:hypothetical protein